MWRALCVTMALLCCVSAYCAETIKREHRAVWCATVWSLDWPLDANVGKTTAKQTAQKAVMTEYLDQMQAAGMNALYFQVRSMCDAMYQSSYEPWSAYISGTRGTSPGWDPLAWVVEECHSRGMECYAWINPMRYATTNTTYTTDLDVANANTWVISYTNDAGKTTKVLNIGKAKARTHIANVVKEIVLNYAVDGVVFDDYFYPEGMPANSTADDYSTYTASDDYANGVSMANWRRNNVNQMISRVYNVIKKNRPDCTFIVSPAGVSKGGYGIADSPSAAQEYQYSKIFSDPLCWMYNGYIDVLSPQLYWATTHSTNAFGPLSQWYHKAAKTLGRNFYASHSITTTANQADIGNQVALNRQYAESSGWNGPGSAIYRALNFTNVASTLKSSYFTSTALTPKLAWYDADTCAYTRYDFPAPTGGAHSGTKLSWTASTNPDQSRAVVRYSIYAIPETIALADAKRSDGDGISADYLLGVTYTNSYTLASTYKSGYWYGVCVYDGYGFESEPLLIDYPTFETLEAPQLLAPDDGSDQGESVKFQWTGVGADYYRVQISTTPDFSTISKSKKVSPSDGGTGSKYATTIKSSNIGLGFWYWRVVAVKEGCTNAVSGYRSLTITSVGVGNYEDGYEVKYDPADYGWYSTGIPNFVLYSKWIRSSDSSYDNFTQDSKGMLNRSFVVSGDYLYISGRSSDATSIYLNVYNRYTGEKMNQLALDAAGRVNSYPCNTVMKDADGNIYIANMTIDLGTDPLVVHRVNTSTGELTEMLRATYTSANYPSATLRVDHVAMLQEDGSLYIYATVSNSSILIRWTLKDGVLTATKEFDLATWGYWPTSAGNFGLAPVVVPLSKGRVYINGANTAFTRYSLASEAITGTMADAPSGYQPASATHNGGSWFPLNSKYYLLYPYTNNAQSPGYTWRLAATNSSYSYSALSYGVTIPEGGLGTVSSGTMQAATDYVVNNDATADVYVYAPGNGIAAYTVTNNWSTGVETVASNGSLALRMEGRKAVASDATAIVEAYTPGGALVASGRGEVTIPAHGLWIVRAATPVHNISTKFVVE
ncbi:MAG: family 10 glycosylhydrolase [Bacteroidales bacterium]|nr:family 10 glycosylhydrolase [Bacteroidales bacterium]